MSSFARDPKRLPDLSKGPAPIPRDAALARLEEFATDRAPIPDFKAWAAWIVWRGEVLVLDVCWQTAANHRRCVRERITGVGKQTVLPIGPRVITIGVMTEARASEVFGKDMSCPTKEGGAR